MGIPGLINAIGSGERISLSKLAISHLQQTTRPIRIAVDISIWLFQVQAGRGGRNPELRTLFYRLLKFLALPIHPLFVYDGKHKPPFKRGKSVSGRSYGTAPIIHLSKILVDLFKFPRHEAPGEAEAECARLQEAGVVDAVMSNDVDALMFGSTFTIMNFSKESGSGTSAATHVTCYNMGSPLSSQNVNLERAGMILFAMLSGGDYLPSGVPKCGSKLAAEIAKAGFGADLLEIIESDGPDVDAKLVEWRERLQYELEENESGYFQTKHKAVRIPETFPDRQVLTYYAKPAVSPLSEINSLQRRLLNSWDQEIDVSELRQFTSHAFDWNYRSGARKVVRLLAEPLVSYRLRLQRHALAFPDRVPKLSYNDNPIFHKVYKSRTSFSTDGLVEIQLDYVPLDIVGLDLMAEEPNPPLPTPMPSQETTVSNVSGDEEEELDAEVEPVTKSPSKKRITKRFDPYALDKIWVFEELATLGIPDVIQRWKKEQDEKATAPKKTSTRKTGPKKKGPIDPGMKRGSILKYGTLTKAKPDISPKGQSHLLEAAVPTIPPTKHHSSDVSGRPLSHDITSSSKPSSKGQPRPRHNRSPSPAKPRIASSDDSELEILGETPSQLSPECTPRPRRGQKGTSNARGSSKPSFEIQPKHNRSPSPGVPRISSSDDSEPEVLGETPTQLSSQWTPTPRRRHRRTSNAGKNATADCTRDATLSPSERASRRNPRRPARSPSKVPDSGRSVEQEKETPTPSRGTSLQKLANETPRSRQKPPSTPRRQTRRKGPQGPSPEHTRPEDRTPGPPQAPELGSSPTKGFSKKKNRANSLVQEQQQQYSSTPLTQEEETPKPKKEPKKKATSTKKDLAETSIQGPSFVESVVASNGYWTIEKASETELASDAAGDAKKNNRSRFSRVEVIDLTSII